MIRLTLAACAAALVAALPAHAQPAPHYHPQTNPAPSL